MKKFLLCILSVCLCLFPFSACNETGEETNSVSEEKETYAVQDLSFEKNTDLEVGGGMVSFRAAGKSKELSEYKIAWAADGERLKDYKYLASYTTERDVYYYEIPYFIYIPQEAEQIVVESYKSGELIDKATVDISNLKRSEKLFEFQVISDLQLDDTSTLKHERAKTAFSQIKEFSPETAGIFIVGDMTDHGHENEYQEMNSIIDEVYGENKPYIECIIGNHESNDGQSYSDLMKLYQKYTGHDKSYFSVEIEGLKFIALGSVKASSEGVGVRCELGTEQINWLEQELAAAGNETTFVFLHQPLKDTVSGSLSDLNQTWDGLNESEVARLRTIFKKHPNAALFTGHTHWHLESERAALIGNGSDANFFNTASVGYLWQGTGAGEEYDGSQGLFVEVYRDYVVVRGREFQFNQWLTSAQFVFSRI
mgnify:FL=1